MSPETQRNISALILLYSVGNLFLTYFIEFEIGASLPGSQAPDCPSPLRCVYQKGERYETVFYEIIVNNRKSIFMFKIILIDKT